VGRSNGDAEEYHVPMKSKKSNKHIIAQILKFMTIQNKLKTAIENPLSHS
jgi:hypothetical protein